MNRITTALFAVSGVMCFAGDTGMTERVRSALAGAWSEVTVTAVLTDSCMGPIHRGFRLSRAEKTISISSVETAQGELRVGRPEPIDETRLQNLLTGATKHFSTAFETIGRQEALQQRLAKLPSEEDRLKEIIRSSREDGRASIGICIAFGQRRTEQRFEDEFDPARSASFIEFITTATK